MKNNLNITYIKNGQEKVIPNFQQNRLSIKDFIYLSIQGRSSFGIPYSKELFEKYLTLKDDIEYICIKNAIFDESLELRCENPNSIFILENCTFKCDWINIDNGNYQIINPTFDVDYKNAIIIFKSQIFQIVGNKETFISSINGSFVNDIKLSDIKKIESLELLSDSKITLDNIGKIEEYNISCKQLELKNWPNTLDWFSNVIDYYHRLFVDTLILENINATCCFDKLSYRSIKLKNSNINHSNDKDIFSFPYLRELVLINSAINSTSNIEFLNIEQLKLDNSSHIKSKDRIQIGKYNYQIKETDNNFILSKDTLNNISFMRKIFINQLKKISIMYNSKIKETLKEEEQNIINKIQREKEKEIKQIEEISNKKIARAKKKIKLKEEETFTNVKINDIN